MGPYLHALVVLVERLRPWEELGPRPRFLVFLPGLCTLLTVPMNLMS